MLKGADISQYQGKPDFTKVKAALDFIIIKATEGVGFTDPQFKRNQTEARKAGIALGYYHFARPDLGNDAVAEAEWFLSVIGQLKEGELLFLDYDADYLTDPAPWCKKWLDHIYGMTKVKPAIYLNKSVERNHNWKPVIEADYGLWIADYTYDINSKLPITSWLVVAFRQYSNREVVNGISGAVDGNVFYGEKEDLLKYGYQLASGPTECERRLAVAGEMVKDFERRLNEEKLVSTSLAEELKACKIKLDDCCKKTPEKITVTLALSLLTEAIKERRW